MPYYDFSEEAEGEGYKLVASIDLGEGYDYYIIRVYKKSRSYYLGTDSGCSCYTPFENYRVADLTGPLTRKQAAEEARSLVDAVHHREVSRESVEEFVTAIRA